MSLLTRGFSAIGKLFVIVGLAVVFLLGMLSVVYLSLRGEEVKVPEVVGKDFLESEKELTQLGLKIKKRALRYSEEKPNTILEQLPKPGETVKTGQTILVVLSQANPEGEEAPATIQKEDTSETEKEGETPAAGATDKPKPNKNTNTTKRPAQSTRDVVANKPAKPANSNTSAANAKPAANTSTGNTSPAARPAPPPNSRPAPANVKPASPPAANKPATTGDTRTRKVP